MPQNKPNSRLAPLERYAYALFVQEYQKKDAPSPSLQILSEWGKRSLPRGQTGNREADVDYLTQNLPQKQKNLIKIIETAGDLYYHTDLDSDEETLEAATKLLNIVSDFFSSKTEQGFQIRNAILNRLYDFDEKLRPYHSDNRFLLVSKMVRDVRNNDGRYDHDPLFTSFKRMKYFFSDISGTKRYQLMLEINKRTQDKQAYNYEQHIASLYTVYKAEEKERKEREKLQKQAENRQRYHAIETVELPKAQTPQEQIPLYREMISLVSDQNWGRAKKFEKKVDLYTKLIPLYEQTGETEERTKAFQERNKFTEALRKAKEAARLKGYDPHSR